MAKKPKRMKVSGKLTLGKAAKAVSISKAPKKVREGLKEGTKKKPK